MPRGGAPPPRTALRRPRASARELKAQPARRGGGARGRQRPRAGDAVGARGLCLFRRAARRRGRSRGESRWRSSGVRGGEKAAKKLEEPHAKLARQGSELAATEAELLGRGRSRGRSAARGARASSSSPARRVAESAARILRAGAGAPAAIRLARRCPRSCTTRKPSSPRRRRSCRPAVAAAPRWSTPPRSSCRCTRPRTNLRAAARREGAAA